MENRIRIPTITWTLSEIFEVKKYPPKTSAQMNFRRKYLQAFYPNNPRTFSREKSPRFQLIVTAHGLLVYENNEI